MITPDVMHMMDLGVLKLVLEQCITTLTKPNYAVFTKRVNKYWVCRWHQFNITKIGLHIPDFYWRHATNLLVVGTNVLWTHKNFNVIMFLLKLKFTALTAFTISRNSSSSRVEHMMNVNPTVEAFQKQSCYPQFSEDQEQSSPFVNGSPRAAEIVWQVMSEA